MGKLRPYNKANASSQQTVLDMCLGLLSSSPFSLSLLHPGPTHHKAWSCLLLLSSATTPGSPPPLTPESTSQNIILSLSVQNRLEAAVLRKACLALGWQRGRGGGIPPFTDMNSSQGLECVHNGAYVEHWLSFGESGILQVLDRRYPCDQPPAETAGTASLPGFTVDA